MAKKLRLTGRASFSSPLTFGIGILRNQVILVDDATGAKLQALMNRESDPDIPVFTLLVGAEAVTFDLTKGVPASPQPDGSVVIDPSRVASLPYRIPKGTQLRGADLIPYGWSDGIGGYVPNGQALVSADRILIGGAQVKVGSFGDSVANINSLANQDLRQVSGVGFMQGDRMGTALATLSDGTIRMVFNGGVSGESTTSMLAREAAGSSATRKALKDAVTSGCTFLVFACGVNDFTHATLAAGASSATIDAAVAATLGRVKQLLRRALALGMVPIIHPILGYSYDASSGSANATLANIPTTQDASRRFNALLKAEVEGAAGLLGHYVDSFYSSVIDSNGDWLPGMSRDGLHPSFNGCQIIYEPIAAKILSLANAGKSPVVYPVVENLFGNADFSASSSGLATGITKATFTGTVTFTDSLNEWRGQLWQDILVTPTALSSGQAGVRIDLTYTAAAILLNDVIGGEVSIYIDDGNFGPPVGVYQHSVRVRAQTVYSDTPGYNPSVPQQQAYLRPIDDRVVSLPIVSPGAAPTTPTIAVIAYTNSLTPFRIRIARPRVGVIPATY